MHVYWNSHMCVHACSLPLSRSSSLAFSSFFLLRCFYFFQCTKSFPLLTNNCNFIMLDWSTVEEFWVMNTLRTYITIDIQNPWAFLIKLFFGTFRFFRVCARPALEQQCRLTLLLVQPSQRSWTFCPSLRAVLNILSSVVSSTRAC
jgi:hypothetical protein